VLCTIFTTRYPSLHSSLTVIIFNPPSFRIENGHRIPVSPPAPHCHVTLPVNPDKVAIRPPQLDPKCASMPLSCPLHLVRTQSPSQSTAHDSRRIVLGTQINSPPPVAYGAHLAGVESSLVPAAVLIVRRIRPPYGFPQSSWVYHASTSPLMLHSMALPSQCLSAVQPSPWESPGPGLVKHCRLPGSITPPRRL